MVHREASVVLHPGVRRGGACVLLLLLPGQVEGPIPLLHTSHALSSPVSYMFIYFYAFFILMFCVVIFFWSSGIMDCTCMLFTFEKKSSARALEGISGVASLITIDEKLQ